MTQKNSPTKHNIDKLQDRCHYILFSCKYLLNIYNWLYLYCLWNLKFRYNQICHNN